MRVGQEPPARGGRTGQSGTELLFRHGFRQLVDRYLTITIAVGGRVSEAIF